MQNFDLVGSFRRTRILAQKRRNTSNCICPLEGKNFFQRQLDTAKRVVTRGVKAAIVGPAKPSTSLPAVEDIPRPGGKSSNTMMYAGVGVAALALFALLGRRSKAA